MIQFTPQQVQSFRQKAAKDPRVIEYLKKRTCEVRTSPLQIPEKGVANWSLYYFCDDCSVELEYHFDKPLEHRCPVCGRLYQGEPYNGAWWRHTNEKNYTAAYECGLLYICTGEKEYAKVSRKILMTFAKYYPDYEVHGDIPYNGPGKANAQTLCEAIFIRTLTTAYDLIEDTLTEEERTYIRERLIRCGAQFLKEHRDNQLHNHEVIIDAAIGVAALVLGDEELIQFAVYEPYGLLYQLEKGMLEDGMWFECSLAYHYYALQNFYGYEKFAVHTKHSHIQHPNYRRMVHFPLKFLKADNSFPLMNDSMYSHTGLDHYSLFEFSYAMFGTEELLWVLNQVYRTKQRDTTEAFFYGVDQLGKAKPRQLEDYHTETGSGVTLIRGSHDQYLLARHGGYGGEHDHYDRLGVSYYYGSTPVAADFGTTGYGAKYHYAYFKNTGTHNTVMIDEKNQAPSAGRVLAYEKDPQGTYLDMQVRWEKDYPMPDSFTICQWSEEAYEGVVMRRRIYKTDRYWIDLFNVNNVQNKTIDWVMHFAGRMLSGAEAQPLEGPLSEEKPLCCLKNLRRIPAEGQVVRTVYQNEQIQTEVYSLLSEGCLLYGQGPSNPTTTTEEYLLQRVQGSRAVFVNVICSHPAEQKAIQLELCKSENSIIIKTDCGESQNTHTYPLS